MSDQPQLVSNLLLPELERQLKDDPKLWPNIKGLFIVTVTKKRKAAATWYITMINNYKISRLNSNIRF
jgi:hypothetical protein